MKVSCFLFLNVFIRCLHSVVIHLLLIYIYIFCRQLLKLDFILGVSKGVGCKRELNFPILCFLEYFEEHVLFSSTFLVMYHIILVYSITCSLTYAGLLTVVRAFVQVNYYSYSKIVDFLNCYVIIFFHKCFLYSAIDFRNYHPVYIQYRNLISKRNSLFGRKKRLPIVKKGLYPFYDSVIYVVCYIKKSSSPNITARKCSTH